MGLGILPPPGLAPVKPPDVQNFTTSGTWTKPDGARYVYVELIGGGGTGPASGTGGNRVAHLFSASDLSAAETVTIGAGGVGAASGSPGGESIFAGLKTRVTPRGWATSADLAVSTYAPQSASDGSVMTRTSAGALVVNDSYYGAGSGSGSSSSGVGKGGTQALPGMLVGGNGANGYTQAPAQSPGGGGSKFSSNAEQPGAPGAARITTIF